MRLTVTVERLEKYVGLLIVGIEGAEQQPLRVPLEAVDARALASVLLEVASLVDPQGHERVLDALAKEIKFYLALQNPLLESSQRH